MCNLSLGIEERAEARGENKKSEKVVMNMYKKGYTTEQIMDIVELGEEEIKDIIESKDRTKAGKTLVPNGLTLMEVNYDK